VLPAPGDRPPHLPPHQDRALNATIHSIAGARQRRDRETRAHAVATLARERALANGLSPDLAERCAQEAASGVRLNTCSPAAALALRGRRRRGDSPEVA